MWESRSEQPGVLGELRSHLNVAWKAFFRTVGLESGLLRYSRRTANTCVTNSGGPETDMEEAPNLPLQGPPKRESASIRGKQGTEPVGRPNPTLPQRGRVEDGDPSTAEQQASGARGALWLTCLLRQRPQEIEGRPLDPHTAQQERAELAPRIGGRAPRTPAQLQQGHRGPQQGRLRPGAGALGLGEREGSAQAPRPAAATDTGPGCTHQGQQQLQVGQGLAQETHTGCLGGQEHVSRHRVSRGTVQQA